MPQVGWGSGEPGGRLMGVPGMCVHLHSHPCVVGGPLTFRSVGNSSLFTRPVAAAMFPAPENTAPPRCDACSLVFSATRAGRGLGKGVGSQGEGGLGDHSPVVTQGMPFWRGTPKSSTTSRPPSGTSRCQPGGGRGVVPGLGWYLRPLLAPPPLGSCFLWGDMGTCKGSEQRDQRSGKHRGYATGKGTRWAAGILAPSLPPRASTSRKSPTCLEPPTPTSSGLPALPAACPSPPCLM